VGIPDSMAKIEAAEQAGAIDHDTALLYGLYAALDYPSLPPDYRSDNPAAPDGTSILAELRGRFERLSPDLQANVAMFFLRPTDPASIWAKRAQPTGAGAGPVALAAYTASGVVDYKYVDAEAAPVRVWYAAPLGEQEQRLAIQLADEIDQSQMWDKERRAMLGRIPCSDDPLHSGAATLGGDDRLDVYLVYPGAGLDWNGRVQAPIASGEDPDNGLTTSVANPDGQCQFGAYIALNGARTSFDALKSTMAHELFHAFQFGFKNIGEPGRGWWMEASAKWAEDLVYPELNREQPYLAGSWSRTPLAGDGPLDSTAGLAAYGAYLWPFYLRQYASGNEEVVGRLWVASESKPPINVMHDLDGWPERFKEFALWNWNAAPVVKYRDAGNPIPPSMLAQNVTCMAVDLTKCLVPVGERTLTLWPSGPTSVQYYEAQPEVDVGRLRFDLSARYGKPGSGIQAIIYPASGEAFVEDWSDIRERTFCLDREDVRRIVLVVSNSSIDPAGTLSGSMPIEAGESCTSDQASALMTKDAASEFVHTWSRLSMDVTGPVDDFGAPYTAHARATVSYEYDKIETALSGTRHTSERGSGTVNASFVCSSTGVEVSWIEQIPSITTYTDAPSEENFLEFQGFIINFQDDPGKKRASGTKTEDYSTSDGTDIIVYTWDCPVAPG
jgi:hypothetical protein